MKIADEIYHTGYPVHQKYGKYRGVTKLWNGRYRVRITFPEAFVKETGETRSQHVGTFDTEEEAALAYNAAVDRCGSHCINYKKNEVPDEPR